ncbi:MAG: chorismate mutase [Pirellulaceae bacterium]|nr:chorismate mutase [Pirellulaceae bacterium]
MTQMCRGVRGATTADANTREDILTASIQLLALMIRLNDIDPEDVSSAIFTVTRDLDAEFPALAARQLGWHDVPLLCTYEIDVPGSLNRCIRILVNWNTEKTQKEIVHAYIKQAKRLRPDLRTLPPIDFGELEAWIAAYMASHEVEVKSAARTAEDPPGP